ncbi:hypothetical protein [Roseobacter sp. MED193]|uniref:hypothetical protein n=1 Tax=Roseobacter sp. MED193 TaxID=314262 RepID=UPI0012EE5FFF|nr:hypothetical protein [Roseobacter sp. MED193]
MTHDLTKSHHGRRPATSLASAWKALCCLPATHAWFWLARSGPVEAAPAIGLVLLDALPRLVDAFGAGAFCHG